VWLEILPETHISHIAVNAQQNGDLKAQFELSGIEEDLKISVSLRKLGEKQWREPKKYPIQKKTKSFGIQLNWEDVLPWTPEAPNLYELKVVLEKNNQPIHEVMERIGFRTLKFETKDGIYVNGKKIVMKGVNRHSIWPESGRSLSKRISIMDANLIKGMNMNAVRMHYPPASHFLEACDSLGLFVLNELAGWQNPYEQELGKKLARSIVRRDVNHPSVIIWDNGNEGGWGKGADEVFKNEDIQNRIVIHPWSDFDGWDTHHYPTYQTGMHRFNAGENVFFPTETMHSTYDNGAGAGLEDFWDKYTQSPLFAGAFIWAYVDEAVKRTDWTGPRKYDSAGNLAPDGIMGPHREKEGSYFTIKDVFSPIQIAPLRITKNFDGLLFVRNNYLYSDLDQCTLQYQFVKVNDEALYSELKTDIVSEGKISLPKISPGETRKVEIDLSEDFLDADWLQLKAFGSNGKEINTWTWPVHHNTYYTDKFLKKQSFVDRAEVSEKNGHVTLTGSGVSVEINSETGKIISVRNGHNTIPLTNGPVPVGMKASIDSIKTYIEKQNAICEVYYSGAMDRVKWTMHPDGRLNMLVTFLKKAKKISGFDGPIFESEVNAFGITFDFPEEEVKGFTWFGRGPYRVWKNRIRGTQYGLWKKEYNNTITGESFENLIYPEFKGYHANFYSGSLNAGKSSFKMFSGSENTFLRLFTPDMPKYALKSANPQPDFPKGDISFLYEIPAMRSFKGIPHHGPKSQPTNIRVKKGDEGITMDIWFDFRKDN